MESKQIIPNGKGVYDDDALSCIINKCLKTLKDEPLYIKEMSIVLSKQERRAITAHAYTLTWRINHGSRAQCSQVCEHVQLMDDIIWYQYAVEEKPDKLGKQYHLHMEFIFRHEKVRDSVQRNILRFGKALGLKEDKHAKITAVSTELNRAFDEHWIDNYCHGKEINEVIDHGVSASFTDDLKQYFPSVDEQLEFQTIANAADEGYARLAIEFEKWRKEDSPTGGYLAQEEYATGDINLTELCSKFLFCTMFLKRQMKNLNERRKYHQLRQCFEIYISTEEDTKCEYWKWFMTERELEHTPKAVKKYKQMKEDELNRFTKSYE